MVKSVVQKREKKMSFLNLRPACKSGTDKKRWTVVWPTPEPATKLIVNPIDIVQNVVRSNGLGFMLIKWWIEKVWEKKTEKKNLEI